MSRSGDLARALGALLSAASIAGCVELSPGPGDRVEIVAPPEDTFPPLGLFLIHRCGSLDCHGAPARDLRLYGQAGERLDPMAVPGSGPTTMAELEADYRSVATLEPELMAAVVKEHGAHPERLTLVRKPFGLEDHAGGTLMKAGDDQAKCLLSWLSENLDMAACQSALMTP
jgi:hypothetical protein